MERDRFNEIDLLLFEATKKVARLEKESRKQSELLEVQELKLERVEEATGNAKVKFRAKEAEAEAATTKV